MSSDATVTAAESPSPSTSEAAAVAPVPVPVPQAVPAPVPAPVPEWRPPRAAATSSLASSAPQLWKATAVVSQSLAAPKRLPDYPASVISPLPAAVADSEASASSPETPATRNIESQPFQRDPHNGIFSSTVAPQGTQETLKALTAAAPEWKPTVLAPAFVPKELHVNDPGAAAVPVTEAAQLSQHPHNGSNALLEGAVLPLQKSSHPLPPSPSMAPANVTALRMQQLMQLSSRKPSLSLQAGRLHLSEPSTPLSTDPDTTSTTAATASAKPSVDKASEWKPSESAQISKAPQEATTAAPEWRPPRAPTSSTNFAPQWKASKPTQTVHSSQPAVRIPVLADEPGSVPSLSSAIDAIEASTKHDADADADADTQRFDDENENIRNSSPPQTTITLVGSGLGNKEPERTSPTILTQVVVTEETKVTQLAPTPLTVAQEFVSESLNVDTTALAGTSSDCKPNVVPENTADSIPAPADTASAAASKSDVLDVFTTLYNEVQPFQNAHDVTPNTICNPNTTITMEPISCGPDTEPEVVSLNQTTQAFVAEAPVPATITPASEFVSNLPAYSTAAATSTSCSLKLSNKPNVEPQSAQQKHKDTTNPASSGPGNLTKGVAPPSYKSSHPPPPSPSMAQANVTALRMQQLMQLSSRKPSLPLQAGQGHQRPQPTLPEPSSSMSTASDSTSTSVTRVSSKPIIEAPEWKPKGPTQVFVPKAQQASQTAHTPLTVSAREWKPPVSAQEFVPKAPQATQSATISLTPTASEWRPPTQAFIPNAVQAKQATSTALLVSASEWKSPVLAPEFVPKTSHGAQVVPTPLTVSAPEWKPPVSAQEHVPKTSQGVQVAQVAPTPLTITAPEWKSPVSAPEVVPRATQAASTVLIPVASEWKPPVSAPEFFPNRSQGTQAAPAQLTVSAPEWKPPVLAKEYIPKHPVVKVSDPTKFSEAAKPLLLPNKLNTHTQHLHHRNPTNPSPQDMPTSRLQASSRPENQQSDGVTSFFQGNSSSGGHEGLGFIRDAKGVDWDCEQCGNVNWSWRADCNKCGNSKPVSALDWTCEQCGNVNWSWREDCNKCGNSRPAENEVWGSISSGNEKPGQLPSQSSVLDQTTTTTDLLRVQLMQLSSRKPPTIASMTRLVNHSTVIPNDDNTEISAGNTNSGPTSISTPEDAIVHNNSHITTANESENDNNSIINDTLDNNSNSNNTSDSNSSHKGNKIERMLNDKPQAILGAFLCPISYEVMVDPVIAQDGHSYDREHIEEWFTTGKTTSPKTNSPLPSLQLIPNVALREAIEEYRQKHGSL